ncbi:helix-turn-helix domain-containing protein [Treponema sp. HNW]|uniref:winged helix-turn-helix domain-containing protein n=1 Tax=Treponema sp. HNW TaxID=3116654 RepID=UPI003D0B9305
MYILILTENKGLNNLLHCVFLQSGCFCKTVRSLSGLFTEIRNRIPECIILDKNFFPDSYTRRELTSCIQTVGLFEKLDSLIFLYDEKDARCFRTPIFQSPFCTRQTQERIVKTLHSAVKKIGSIAQIPEGFRPVEKKLYSLLKKRAEEELSLEEMCKELWGERTDGNTKTLYTYIYRIKHILEENVSRPEALIKAKKGCYKLTFFPSESL